MNEHVPSGEEIAEITDTSEAPRRKRKPRKLSDLLMAVRDQERTIKGLNKELEKAREINRDLKDQIKKKNDIIKATDRRIARAMSILEDPNGE
jgi:hypothetical protein